MVLLLLNINQAESAFSVCIRLSAIIFLFVLIVFNICLINATDETFKKYCNYDWLAWSVAALIALMIVISFIIKCLK